MFIADTHTHTKYSFDGKTDVNGMIHSALEHGVAVLALTEHCDFGWQGYDPYYARGEAACQKEMTEQKTKETRLKLLYGVELGQPQRSPEKAKALLAAHPYDIVLGSVHELSDGRDIYSIDYTDYAVCEACFLRYFDDLEDLLVFGDFDVFAHLDYPLRVMQGAFPEPSLRRYRERIAELMRKLAKTDCALEVNAKGCREWIGQPGPEQWVLELYRDFGGKLIAAGSDAHFPKDCGSGLRESYRLIARAGFSQIVTFEKRKPVFHPIG